MFFSEEGGGVFVVFGEVEGGGVCPVGERRGGVFCRSLVEGWQGVGMGCAAEGEAGLF